MECIKHTNLVSGTHCKMKLKKKSFFSLKIVHNQRSTFLNMMPKISIFSLDDKTRVCMGV